MRRQALRPWRENAHKRPQHTGDMYDGRNPMPDWVHGVAEEIGLQRCGFVFQRMETGVMVQPHVADFRDYQDLFKIDRSRIWRAIVFLDNWRPGHYFEIDGQPIMDYVMGDYIVWSADTPQAASNVGLDTRYTLQITGTDLRDRQEQQGYYHEVFWNQLPFEGGRNKYYGFMEEKLTNARWLLDSDDSWIIWTGTGRIRKLETLQLNQSQISGIDDSRVTIYLNEPLSLYEHTMNRNYYHEFAAPYPLQSMRALELDSISKFAQRHDGKLKVVVRTGDRGSSVLKQSYPNLDIETLDIFLRQDARSFPMDLRDPDHLFWCGNWRWTPHRHMVMAYLSQWPGIYSWHLTCGFDVLADNGWLDMSQLKRDDPRRYACLRDGTERINAKAYQIDNGDFQLQVKTVADCAIPQGTAPDCTSREFLMSYSRAAIAVVTESRYASPFANFSEKTLGPMGMRRPLIVAAPHGTLAYMRELGFKTFDKWWDESYDAEPDPAKRLLMIFDLCDQLSKQGMKKIQRMLVDMRPVLEHNAARVDAMCSDDTVLS